MYRTDNQANAVRFRSLHEDYPGNAWAERFAQSWPLLGKWWRDGTEGNRPGLGECEDAFQRYMPELIPVYTRLKALVGDDEDAARCLSLWRGPRMIGGCSVAMADRPDPILIRNYDFAPALIEGTVLLSRWSDRRVIAMSDAFWGVLDGINDAGLAVALTFGGDRAVGEGFAVTLILRYILETCATVDAAAAALRRIPCAMAQNVALIDATGTRAAAHITPGREARIVEKQVITNHQEKITWPEAVRSSRSVEREAWLLERLSHPLMREWFLDPPLYQNNHAHALVTLYGAEYRPMQGTAFYFWPDTVWELSFDKFSEHDSVIQFEPG